MIRCAIAFTVLAFGALSALAQVVDAVAAIGMTVRDLDRSVVWYSEVLSFEKVDEIELAGADYERLHGVFGARLRITTLRAASGPGIELLEYLAPRDGRPYPSDSRANDLWHWQTTLTCAQLDPVEASARAHGAALVSPGAIHVVDIPGIRKGILARDRDGHALRLVQRN